MMSIITITLTPEDTETWVTRPGNKWPCSTLRGQGITVELRDGDLITITADDSESIDGHELNACLNDHLEAAKAKELQQDGSFKPV